VAAATAAAVIGEVAGVDEDWRASGYLTHPCQIDAALHLGVAPPGSGAKIPVALGALHAPLGPAEPGRPARAGCLAGPAAPKGGTGVASFHLATSDSSAAGAGGGVVLEGLETRVLGAAASARPGASAAAAAAAGVAGGAEGASGGGDEEWPRASYEVVWAVSDPAAPLYSAGDGGEPES
jgi:hypothetical protein